MDLLYVAVAVGFFAVTAYLVRLCGSLGGRA